MKLLFWLAHLALDEIDNLFRLGDGIVFGGRAHDDIIAIEQNHRWRDAFAIGVWDDLRLAVGVDVRHRAEGRSKIDSDCFALRHFPKVPGAGVAAFAGATFVPKS